MTGGAGGIGGMIVHRLSTFLEFETFRANIHMISIPSSNARFLSDGAKVAIVDLDPEVTSDTTFLLHLFMLVLLFTFFVCNK